MTYMKNRLIPETKGRSLEDMDIIFGSISADQRRANIEQQEKGADFVLVADKYNCSCPTISARHARQQ